MTEAEIVELLGSGDYDRADRAIAYIHTYMIGNPTQKIIDKVIDLISDKDPDNRSKAINLAGLHWKIPGSFHKIRDILVNGERDEIVLNSAVYAIGEMARIIPELHKDGLEVLSMVSLDESIEMSARLTSYIMIMFITGKISISEFSRLNSSSTGIDIDRDWLNSLLY